MSGKDLRFYDSAAPLNVPFGSLAGVYVNGYAWSPSEVHRMHAVFGISVLPEARWADRARCIDVETGAASPGDVVPFLQYRERLGHRDGTVYVNRGSWDAVRADVDQALRDGTLHHHPRYWVATLDGTTRVADEWATQAWGGNDSPYDVSVLHGVHDFTEPGRFHAA